MGYLEEMNLQLENQNFLSFIQLWEEYRSSTDVPADELIEIFETIRDSEYQEHFGPYAEEGLELIDKLDDPERKLDVLRAILDLQTTNSEILAQQSLVFLKENYGDKPHYNEKIRLVGLRSQAEFKGAIRNFELLTHMEKGKFIYHTGGWGVGEIIDISLIREQLSIEFENVLGVKELSFKNAFHNLVPVSETHFLAQRFGNPDQLEKEAKEDPLAVLKLLISDVGPLNAHEIKDELFEVVIPANDWAKWWQSARAKLKKDPQVKPPESISQPFVLLDHAISHLETFKELLEKDLEVEEFLQKSYQYTKQHLEVLKDSDLKALYREKLLKHLAQLHDSQELLKIQIYILIEDIFNDHLDQALVKVLQSDIDIDYLINAFHIGPLKKRFLEHIRKQRSDWPVVFSGIFLNISQHFLREYVLKELVKAKHENVQKEMLKKLLEHPVMYPECFFWYFQKLQLSKELLYSNKEGLMLFFESLFVLLYHIENKPEYNDLVKKIHAFISKKHYQLFRDNVADTPIEFVREILLLVTKCQTFDNHDFKTFLSLAKVVHPKLEDQQGDLESEESVIWTTQEGYHKIQERIHHIATVETVQNAKEIEVARSYGDLRENSEYKFAQEKRARLQSEMKLLSSQLGQARILSPDDIDVAKVGVGTIVELVNLKGKTLKYTILGPWDADPDKSILSFQSQLAVTMAGHKINESFDFKDDTYTVNKIKSYLD
ncbi:MAG: Transcription elongation factor GreA [Chlamydiae bacterium]|nr:Transcription elongation factor GreA [Chlamydiota bacterium]